MTRLPSTAKKAYGSSCSTSAPVSVRGRATICAVPMTFALLKTRGAGGPGHEIGNLRRRRELRVLTLEVRFRHPTGAGATCSNVDRDLRRERFRQDLLERRPAEGHQVLRNGVSQKVDGLVGEDD